MACHKHGHKCGWWLGQCIYIYIHKYQYQSQNLTIKLMSSPAILSLPVFGKSDIPHATYLKERLLASKDTCITDIGHGCTWGIGLIYTHTSIKKNTSISSWWFQPLKWESSPNRGKNKTYLKPPPGYRL